MNKRFLKSFILLVSASSSLLASNERYYMDDENDPAKLKKELMGKITPPVTPIVKHGIDAFVIGNFIYWNTRVDNLSFYQKTTLSSQEYYEVKQKGSSTIGSINQTNPNYNPSSKHSMAPGFKVGAGANSCHDGWDLLARYTWLHSHSKTQTQNSLINISDNPSFSFFQNQVFVTNGMDEWKLHFNALDLELGRTFFISPKLILRPFISLKGSWQTQYYDQYLTGLNKQVYDLSNTHQNLFSSTGALRIYKQVNYWGLGLRSGLGTSWQFNDQFSIFGDTAFALMWSNFKSLRQDYSSNSSSSTAEVSYNNLEIGNLVANHHTISPVAEIQIGFRWETKFSNDDYRIRLQAGWEEQVWFNQNQFINLNQPPFFGNLCMQGLNIEVRLDF